jgi:aquaporin Z
MNKKYAMLGAEMIGTFVLTSAVLSIAKIGVFTAILPWFIGITVAITITVMGAIFGPVSGGHFNPAVTLGLLSIRQIELVKALSYISVQLLGAVLAMTLFRYIKPASDTLSSLPNIAGEYSPRILIAEAAGAVVFGMGVAAVVRQKVSGIQGSFLIGASLMLGVLVAQSGSNAILNPAIAVALNSVSLIYIAGPVVGVVFGMNLYNLLFSRQK